MGFILTAKEISELVTSISAAIIVLIQAFKIIPKPIKNFFVKTIPVFFCGNPAKSSLAGFFNGGSNPDFFIVEVFS